MHNILIYTISLELSLYTCYYHGRTTKEVIIMFKRKIVLRQIAKWCNKCIPKGYDQVVKDYKALEPFRKYPQRIINVTNKFIKGKMHALRDYVDGYEDAKQQLSQN